MLVSVVITTRNEEKNIRSCLESIKNQSFPWKKIEIIIVDNNSSDRTTQIAGEYTKKVFNKGPERSVQRNWGAQKAQGDFLLYLDADMRLSSMVIQDCVNVMRKGNNVIAVYIPEIVTGNSFWSKARRFERSFYDATPVDAVRFVRTDDFRTVGGFDTKMTGPEDWDFDKKIRRRGAVDIITSPIYHNEANFSISKYLSKKAYYIKSLDEYVLKWGKHDPDIQKQLGFFYRFFGVFVENGKWKKLVRHPFLSIGMLTLRLLIGVIYITRKK